MSNSEPSAVPRAVSAMSPCLQDCLDGVLQQDEDPSALDMTNLTLSSSGNSVEPHPTSFVLEKGEKRASVSEDIETVDSTSKLPMQPKERKPRRQLEVSMPALDDAVGHSLRGRRHRPTLRPLISTGGLPTLRGMKDVKHDCQEISRTGSFIRDGIYVGPKSATKNAEWLTAHNIKYILSIGIDYTELAPEAVLCGVKHLQIRCHDHPKERIRKHFDEANCFIERAVRSNEQVLIHCRAGVSRSATIATGFLMTFFRMTLKEAYGLVQFCRNVVRPNQGFCRQLLEYEEELYGQNSLKLDDFTNGNFWAEFVPANFGAKRK